VTAGGGAALTLALVVAGVAAMSGGDGEDSVVMAPMGDDGEGSDSDVAYLVPNDVPDDMELVHASGGDQPELPAGSTTQLSEWDTTQRWLRTTNPPEIVDVQSTDDVDTIDEIDFALGMADTATVVNGHAAAYSSADGSIAWLTADGRAVRVTSAGDSVQSLEKLQAFAGLVGDGIEIPQPSASLPDPVADFAIAAQWSGSPAPGLNPRALVYQAADGTGFQLHVVDHSELSPAMNLSFPGASFPGVAGLSSLSSQLVAPPRVDDPRADFVADADLYLQWVGDHGELITLSGVGLSVDELKAIAEDLKPVDAATWFELQGRSDVDVPGADLPGVSATTLPDAVSSSTLPPVETPALPGAEMLDGVFSGVEHYTLTRDAGCEVHSILDTTWTHGNGATWTYHADYCGKLSGTTWSSSGGTVTITTEDGSTITGTMNAQTVSTVSHGEPYGLSITGGTGAYAGAAGSCNLDNHLVAVALGEQQQSGNFSCSISH
jgi:hypothetical protein